MQRYKQLGESLRLRLGLFGATALCAVTGYNYLHEGSDIDLLLDTAPREAICEFAKLASELEKSSNVRCDIEFKFAPWQYLKLKELLSDQNTVLVKGGEVPELLLCRTVWETLQSADIK